MRVPGLDSPDFPALEVLSDVLSSHRFELYGLVPQGKALDAEFLLDPLPKAGLAYANVAFLAGEDPKATESAVRAILAKVARDGVPAELVEAAKIQERSAAQFQKNSISELASIWSDAVALYGLSSPDEDLQRIEKVTVDDVNRVARKYLDLDHAVSAVMLPRGSGKPVAASAGFGGRESISLGEAKPTQLPKWAETALHRVTVPPSTLHPVVSVLPNGLTLDRTDRRCQRHHQCVRTHSQPAGNRRARRARRHQHSAGRVAFVWKRETRPRRLRTGIGCDRCPRAGRGGFLGPDARGEFRERRRSPGG